MWRSRVVFLLLREYRGNLLAVIAFLVTAVILARNPKHPTSKFKQFIDLAQIMEVTVKALPSSSSALVAALVRISVPL